MPEPATFRVCSICRKPIAFGQVYYVCSVSTCNRTRTALFFCSVGCWSDHLPTARHRDAWAEERVAPKQEGQGTAARMLAQLTVAPAAPTRTIV
jgi:hypothetical protein